MTKWKYLPKKEQKKAREEPRSESEIEKLIHVP
jgi:hypothetical protein